MTFKENFYTLSLKLLEHRKEYYHSEFTDNSTDNYFKKSLDDIHIFLKNKYRKGYLFSSIAYSHDGKVKALPYRFNLQSKGEEKKKKVMEYIIELVNYLTQNLINEEKHLSFTQIMLSEKNRDNPIKVLLYEERNSEESKKYKPIDIVEFDLSQPTWEKLGNIEKFKKHDFIGYQYGFPLYEKFQNSFGNPFKVMVGDPPDTNNVEEFNRLISIYLELNACFKGTKYFYFIKPQSSHDVFSGVLLLGLKERIPIDEFTLWVHLFYRLLSEISIKKIQQLAATKENAQATSHFGHLLRYRLSPPGQYIDLLGKEIDRLKKILPYKNKSNVDSLERFYKGASTWFQKTINTGFLLNIRAHYFEKPDAGHKVFNERDIWREDKPFDLLDSLLNLISELNENKIQIHTARTFVPFNLVKECSVINIEPWFQLEGNSYRPFSILYEDLIFEVLINAFKASPLNEDIEIKIIQGKINGEIALIIKNKIDKIILKKNLRKYGTIKGEWKTFKDFSSSIGGLSYWSHLIDVTKVGKVFIRTIEEKERDEVVTYFETGLLLEGLKIVI